MKYAILFLLFLTVLPLPAQKANPAVMRDREVLPKKLWDAYDNADLEVKKAFTAIEQKSAVGSVYAATESLLIAAAQYRLKRLPEAERGKFIRNLYHAGTSAESILFMSADPEKMDPVAREYLAHDLLFLHVKTWTLSDSQYEQWNKIASAKFVFENETYQLKNGIGNIYRKGSDSGCWTAVILPELFLEYNGDLYALVAVDRKHAPLPREQTSFFCKLKNDGILHPIHEFRQKNAWNDSIVSMNVSDTKIIFLDRAGNHCGTIPLSAL